MRRSLTWLSLLSPNNNLGKAKLSPRRGRAGLAQPFLPRRGNSEERGVGENPPLPEGELRKERMERSDQSKNETGRYATLPEGQCAGRSPARGFGAEPRTRL